MKMAKQLKGNRNNGLGLGKTISSRIVCLACFNITGGGEPRSGHGKSIQCNLLSVIFHFMYSST